jgi:mannitol-specific phosphotransferase system IIBC component
MSNKCCTPLCKGTVQNDATLCKERCDFMLGRHIIGKIWLRAKRTSSRSKVTKTKKNQEHQENQKNKKNKKNKKQKKQQKKQPYVTGTLAQ